VGLSGRGFFDSHIIAILAAIPFPVFAKAREKARQSSCLSNEKQIGLACLQYFQDYDECLLHYRYETPYALYREWQQLIEPYLKNTQVLRCPSASTYALAYGWNYSYLCWPGRGGTSTSAAASLGQVTNPAETIMLGESKNATVVYPPSLPTYIASYGDPARHNEAPTAPSWMGTASGSGMRSSPPCPTRTSTPPSASGCTTEHGTAHGCSRGRYRVPWRGTGRAMA